MSHDICASGTHRPVLRALLERTLAPDSATPEGAQGVYLPGPVLELGMGDCSTPMLHDLCMNKRLLVSMDHNWAWGKRYMHLADPLHWVRVIPDHQNWFYMIESRRWSVALLDCAPAETRAMLLPRLAITANYVVIHDTEPEQAQNYPGMREAMAKFSSRVDIPSATAWTTVVSLKKDVAWLSSLVSA